MKYPGVFSPSTYAKNFAVPAMLILAALCGWQKKFHADVETVVPNTVDSPTATASDHPEAISLQDLYHESMQKLLQGLGTEG